MIYHLGFFSDIGFSIKQAFRTLSGELAALLYNIIVDLYDVFMYVARADILDGVYVQKIYNRVGMILGLFMVFKLVFSLIQSLVEPDKITDEKSGFAGIIKRSIIAIVLLGITPSLFDMAFDIQNEIVGTENSSNNIIYKFIVADAEFESSGSFGSTIATNLFFSFYTERAGFKLNDGISINYPEPGENNEPITVEILNYNTLKTKIRQREYNFSKTVDYLTIHSGGSYGIEWDALLSIGIAIFMIFTLINYTIQVATRVVQLAYLQLIAPIPILSYISDPDGAFKRWLKQCTTTYLDLFLRLAIIYFIVTLSTQIVDIFDRGGDVLINSIGISDKHPAAVMVKIFLIIGLLMFGKRVPELLKDLFPSTGGVAGLGFGIKGIGGLIKDIPGSGLVKGAATFGAGAAIGGVAGMASGIKNGYGFRGKLAGAFGGLNRGFIGGAKTKGSVLKNVQGGMNSTRLARQRALDKKIYKIDNNKYQKEFQRNQDIMAAKKAIDDRAESQLLKSDAGAQKEYAKLQLYESNIGKEVYGKTITEVDVVAQKAAYKSYMDGAKKKWVDDHTDDIDVATNMQKISNITNGQVNNYDEVDAASSTAKTRNSTIARDITAQQGEKAKIQNKKSKIK